MRPRIALVDAALGPMIWSLAQRLPSQWQWTVVALSESDVPPAVPRIIPQTKSQSCQCVHARCIRDAVAAWLPERAIVAGVLVRPHLLCLAHCCDGVFVPKELAAWCHHHGIPARSASTIEQVQQLFIEQVRRGKIASRHRAQLYRNYLAEVE